VVPVPDKYTYPEIRVPPPNPGDINVNPSDGNMQRLANNFTIVPEYKPIAVPVKKTDNEADILKAQLAASKQLMHKIASDVEVDKMLKKIREEEEAKTRAEAAAAPNAINPLIIPATLPAAPTQNIEQTAQEQINRLKAEILNLEAQIQNKQALPQQAQLPSIATAPVHGSLLEEVTVDASEVEKVMNDLEASETFIKKLLQLKKTVQNRR